MVELLQEWGTPVFRCDTADFPQRLVLDARLDADGRSGVLRTEHREASLTELRSIWYRRPTHFTFPDGLSDTERDLAASEARFGLGGVLAALPVLWVNHPGREADAAYKPRQLAVAARCGLRVPRTLVTNDAGAVADFRGQVTGPLISKLMGASAFAESGTAKIVYTTRLDDDDLAELRGVGSTAHLFQEWVPKAYEVRLTVVGPALFAAAIHGRSDAAVTDWRSDYDALDYRAVDVPADVRVGITAFNAGTAPKATPTTPRTTG